MSDLVEVIAMALAEDQWDHAIKNSTLDVKLYWRSKARAALAALEREGYEVKKQPIELKWYDE